MNSLKRLCLIVLLCFLLPVCSQSQDGASPQKNNGQEEDSGVGFGIPMDFYRQCTGRICEFDLYRGEKGYEFSASTWHPRDTGILINGDEVVIGACDENVTHPDVPISCFAISVLGHWDENVQMALEVRGEYGSFGFGSCETDAALDGFEESETQSSDFVWRLPLQNRNWEPEHFIVRSLKQQGLMRFLLYKTKPGDAVFYYVKVEGLSAEECPANAIEVD